MPRWGQDRWASWKQQQASLAAGFSKNERGELGRREFWASRVTLDRERQLKVAMNGTGLTDEEMGQWCAWFCEHMVSFGSTAKLFASLVDFAENKLTSAGAAMLLETFTASGIPVLVLKLHHNRIDSGSGIAEYLRTCDGHLQELHLSHNELDANASAVIISAAASAIATDGGSSYPRRSGARGLVPLWLRIEQNYIDSEQLNAVMDHFTSESLCKARNKWCTPHCCASKMPPAVHAKNLGNQRRCSVSSTLVTSVPSTAAEEQKCDKSKTPDSTVSNAACSAVETCLKSQTTIQHLSVTPDTAQGQDGDANKDVELAHILRWDSDRGRWVPDVIEVPPMKELIRCSMPQEQQKQLSLGLKALIGIGEKRACAGESSSIGTPDGQAAPVRGLKAGATLKTHRRGSQPSSGDVRQAQVQQAPNLMRILREEGFQMGGGDSLNPQAPDFRPSTLSFADLNPEAKEFKPQGWENLKHAMSKPSLVLSRSMATKNAVAEREGSAVRLLAAGVREKPVLVKEKLNPVKERPMPVKVPLPSEIKFGQHSDDDNNDDDCHYRAAEERINHRLGLNGKSDAGKRHDTLEGVKVHDEIEDATSKLQNTHGSFPLALAAATAGVGAFAAAAIAAARRQERSS